MKHHNSMIAGLVVLALSAIACGSLGMERLSEGDSRSQVDETPATDVPGPTARSEATDTPLPTSMPIPTSADIPPPTLTPTLTPIAVNPGSASAADVLTIKPNDTPAPTDAPNSSPVPVDTPTSPPTSASDPGRVPAPRSVAFDGAYFVWEWEGASALGSQDWYFDIKIYPNVFAELPVDVLVAEPGSTQYVDGRWRFQGAASLPCGSYWTIQVAKWSNGGSFAGFLSGESDRLPLGGQGCAEPAAAPETPPAGEGSPEAAPEGPEGAPEPEPAPEPDDPPQAPGPFDPPEAPLPLDPLPIPMPTDDPQPTALPYRWQDNERPTFLTLGGTPPTDGSGS